MRIPATERVDHTADGEAMLSSAVATAVEQNGETLLRYFARRTGHPEDAADLLGETLLIVWRKASQMPRDNVESRMWMFGIARKVLSTHRRGERRRLALADRLRGELSTRAGIAGPDGRPTNHDDEVRSFVRSLILDLDPRDQEIVTLVHWEGFALAEVANVIGMKPSTVRSRYARARAYLQLALTESGDIA